MTLIVRKGLKTAAIAFRQVITNTPSIVDSFQSVVAAIEQFKLHERFIRYIFIKMKLNFKFN
jgi:hypothetical protein